MKSYIYLLIGILFLPNIFFSQTLISDKTEFDPVVNTNAILELRSASQNKGMLLPRVALSAINLSAPFSVHIAGIMIYNTQTAGTGNNKVTPGLYYNDGTQWYKIKANVPVIGDVKYSSRTTDHDGWYLLNGRAINTLPSGAQTSATGLGFAANIPNAADRFLKAKSGVETLGAAGGNSSVILTQANLPNMNFNGTALDAGTHLHSYNERGVNSVISAEINSVTTVDDNTVNSSLTSVAPNHTHTFSVPTGGTSAPIVYKPSYLVTNIFIYLGN